MSHAEPQAEFTCLNLNIYAPSTALNGQGKLPVLVWIHGGAFRYGDGTSDYDGNWIVEHSMKINKPMTVVTIQYRLGFYGFLSSKELQEEARENGEVGFANVALHDQRLGLQWVQENIHFFGGNASEVTLSGESAGAWSVMAHTRSDYPGFKRAFVLSGPSFPLATPAQQQETFDRLVSSIGLQKSAPAADKLAALRSLSQSDLEKLYAPGAQQAGWDNVWFTNQEYAMFLEDSRPFPSWIEAVVIGATKHECALWSSSWLGLGSEACVSLVKDNIEDADMASRILSKYRIGDTTIEDLESRSQCAVDGLVQFITHGLFGCIPHTVASTHPELPVLVYRFDQTDDDPRSPARGKAYHSSDNSYFFNYPNLAGPDAPEHIRSTARDFVGAAISLANGEQSWEPFSKAGKMMIFGGDAHGLKISSSEGFEFSEFCATSEGYEKFTGAARNIMMSGMAVARDQLAAEG